MKWYDDLYIGLKAIEKQNEIIEKINNGIFQVNKFVLALPFNDSDVLDIYPSNILTQSHYMKSDIVIIGIANGMDDAKEVMQSAIMECYTETGNFDLRSYIMSKMA